MEPHSQVSSEPTPVGILEGQIRECFGRVVYSHKTHEKLADILLGRLSLIKWGQIILSAMVTAGCISVVFGTGRTGIILSAVISTLLLVLNSYTKDYDLGELAQKSRHAASDLWIIREKYLSLLTDLRMGTRTIDDMVSDRDRLLEELHGVYSVAPSTNKGAYTKAQEALKKLEDMTFADEEIDAFLPRELKKAGRTQGEPNHDARIDTDTRG